MTRKRKEPSWDDKPQYFVLGGVAREVFYRSHLDKALNRKLGTIRSMEREGVLCHPRFKNKQGWWLYTRDQVEDLIKLAIEEKVIDPNYRNPFSERFKTEALSICRRKPS